MKAVGVDRIENRIHLIRGHRVILDADLAAIFAVPTKRLNEQVKRNPGRFPEDFAFHLTAREAESLRSQFATSKQGRGGRRSLPMAFTEHGAIMAANVLNSLQAVEASVFVVRAFVKLRSVMSDTRVLTRRLGLLEREIQGRLDVHETAIVDILRRVMDLLDPPQDPDPPRRRIGFRAPGARGDGTQ